MPPSLDDIRREIAELRRDHPDCVAEVVADRWVRVMGDHSAWGVWERPGGAITPEYLPIPIELMQRIHRWQDDYERVFDPHDMAATDPEARRCFSEEGLAIAVAVKRHLPDWTVVYFDEHRYAEAEAERDGSAPEDALVGPEAAGDRRSAWQYEITGATTRPAAGG